MRAARDESMVRLQIIIISNIWIGFMVLAEKPIFRDILGKLLC